ncbi:MAG: redoxin domain-containing protein [Sphingobacteriaceae bacterium]|nr:redoxin domain-containing protein [Sphingobacteriaceae bacterium]
MHGKAHTSYAGKLIELISIQDFITGARFRESLDTIDKDGSFDLQMYSNHTQPVFLIIKNVKAKLYVSPDFVYEVRIPETDESADFKNDAELEINLGVVGADSTELNALIFDFQNKYNAQFLTDKKQFLSRPVIFQKADSLQFICEKSYKNIKNKYFQSFYNYSIASLNASVSRGENFLISKYILNSPIQYHHAEYMSFFNACFTGYLNSIASTRKGETLYNIINTKASYELLDEFVKQEKFMINDSLRELVILKNLWELYFNTSFNAPAINKIVSEINQSTKIEKHRQISAHMLSNFNQLQNGSPAPFFSARDKKGNMADLNEIKGKWIYLNFFSTKKTESTKELYKIAALKKKLGDKIIFVSVCVDDSLSTYTSFMKNNAKLDWNIWYYQDKRLQKNAKELYHLVGHEAYYLINNAGYLAQSPALSPSEGIEYKLNSIFKPVKKNIKTGIR